MSMEGPVSAPPATPDQQPAEATSDGTATTAPGRRKLKRSTRIGLIVILVLALVAAGAFGVSYFLNARNYVTTDNAQIDGDKILLNAPTSGTLQDWRATLGTVLYKDEIVGRIKIPGGFAQPLMSIRSPSDGTVAVDDGVSGGFVTAGTQLGVAYDFAKIYVTARVDETDIKQVRVGQPVDMTVDAFSNAQLTGYVREIQGGAAGQFSLFPQGNTSGNFQKVTQVIPVKISIADRKGLDLVPGMNVTVHIHIR
ncbi:MAG TPA: HlyD family efflux transporter periplasmic adaptor subunit [Pseudonocardiaceae bacterium]